MGKFFCCMPSSISVSCLNKGDSSEKILPL